jgi:hypothetical protein
MLTKTMTKVLLNLPQDVLDQARVVVLAEELPDDGTGDRSRQTRLGSLLRRHKDKVIAGWRLRSRNDGKRAVHRLELPAAAAPAGQK